MRRFLMVMFGILTISVAQAAIYKSYDKNGNVVFSDIPNGEEIQTKPIMTVPALPQSVIKEKTTQTKPDVNEPSTYTLSFKTPSPDQLFSPEVTSIAIEAVMTPVLWKDHKIEMWIDGKLYGTALTASLNAVEQERGEHVAEVKIVNKTNKVLAMATTRFTIQRPIVRKK